MANEISAEGLKDFAFQLVTAIAYLGVAGLGFAIAGGIVGLVLGFL